MLDVITIGSATKDVFLQSSAFTLVEDSRFVTGEAECLPLGSKLAIDALSFATGGGGTNTAVTFARQGFRIACIASVGMDKDGEELLHELTQEGVDCSMLAKHPDTHTGYSIVLLHGSGERTILNYSGASHMIDSSVIASMQDIPKWLYVDSCGGDTKILNSVIDLKKKHSDMHIASNPGLGELKLGLDELAPFFSQLDVLLMNTEEAVEVTHSHRDDKTNMFRILSRFVKGTIVLTEGKKGLTAMDVQQNRTYSAGTPDSPRVDATGAGDAFGSAFVAGLIKDLSLEESIQQGVANASSVVAQLGAKSGILKKDEIETWPMVEVFVR